MNTSAADSEQLEWLMLLEEELQIIADEEDYLLACAAVGIIVHGAEEKRRIRAERRQMTRQYLVRNELLPNPRTNTPWQRLFSSQSDRAFITTMGVDVKTFWKIMNAGFGYKWFTRPIPRTDAPSIPSGDVRPNRRSLDATGALGLVLHYLNSTMNETSLQEIFALIPSTVSRYISFSLDILLETLQDIAETRVLWPQGEQFEENSNIIQERHPLLDGAFGSIDGLNLPVQTSPDLEIENATYNGWLAEHFISSVLAFSPRGTIIAARLNAPGSWHDSRVAQPIYEKLRSQTPEGYYLVADTAFPRGSDQIDGRIKAPIKVGTQLRGTREEIEQRMAFDRQLLSYRQTAEWGMRALQGSFGRLRIPLPIACGESRANLLETCVRLHNLRTNDIGINQIKSVYMRHWVQNVEDERMWSSFESILFGEQKRNDRVARFYTTVEFEE